MDTFDEQDWRATYRRDCPSRTVLEVLANKWAIYILGVLRRHDRPVRFNELRRLLDGITQKMLTQTLKTLERDGIVLRQVYPTVPPRVDYSLTSLGREVGELTDAVATWSLHHVDAIKKAREDYDSRPEPAPV
jgi:DNA-binding HxlR family transcriptional regulator